jgi:8-oxo-dGTP pyrophosphatase MutT (NUDIX family)
MSTSLNIHEINEYPEFGMMREVLEEVGWKIEKYKEVTRQWKMGAIKGFVYLAIPENMQFLEDEPPRIHCEEVQTVKYFNLIQVLNDSLFPPVIVIVKGNFIFLFISIIIKYYYFYNNI